jgi:2-polyprenyl-3-methyl-5-hydroxy-6-metoxy-1,4-benzoquinol methylase
MGKEQNKDYYNKGFAESPHYSLEVKAEHSRHSGLYKAVLSLLNHNERIFEVGCGTGQFAEMIINSGFNYVQGFDFSEVAVNMSKSRTGKDLFQVGDIIDWDFNRFEYSTVIALEVFEHINGDIDAIKRIPKGTRLIFSLPTFDDQAHVRYFKRAYQITARYATLFTTFNITKVGRHHIIEATI